jgi:glucosamine--fructose-6-phosphate aminotransferase (isomerizing)
MCGIVGYAGPRDASEIVLEGLKRLEYRGYDSAGLAIMHGRGIEVRRSVGKLAALESVLRDTPVHGQLGIGHTRWATHGSVSEENAHPHTDCRGEVVVIHNGIVENYLELKTRLTLRGHTFRSQTDTEVIAHLIEDYEKEGADTISAARRALRDLEGANAVVIMDALAPKRVIAARLGNAGGVVVGIGDEEMFVASDVPAIVGYTQRLVFLEDQELAVIQADGAEYSTLSGQPVRKEVRLISWDPVSAEKGGHRHFMLKEIREQPRSITDTIRGRVDFEAGRVNLDIGLDPDEIKSLSKVHSVACGTAYYAALVGKFMIERLARVPVEVDYGSEFRYRDPLLAPQSLLLAVSQSGETVDTLAAMEEARRKGLRSVAIVNAVGSQASRLADGVIYLNAGPEIGVASTKAFTSQLVAQFLLGLYLGQERRVIGEAELRGHLRYLAELPNLAGKVLGEDEQYGALAQAYFRQQGFLYLGRGINYPIALEGALKLKEISYIHAEGYPAGEMKHGPIALIDENMPVVAIVGRDAVRVKMLSNVEQVKARGGVVIAVAVEGDEEVAAKADHVIEVPETSPLLAPVLAVLPLQLLAYHIAVRRGCDVDQPRNLAKSVTVE